MASAWQQFGLTIIDYSIKANVWINLKNSFNFNDLNEMDTCDVFYETHIKGISSFGMTKNVLRINTIHSIVQILGDGFIKYGTAPASRAWVTSADINNAAYFPIMSVVIITSCTMFLI